MLKAAWARHRLNFRFKAITSRGSMMWRDTYFIKVWDDASAGPYGIGEASPLRGLSRDDVPGFEDALTRVCAAPKAAVADAHMTLRDWPSIRFALETAVADLSNGGRRIIYPSEWTAGDASLTINGLVWMGNADEMARRMEEKVAQGFNCIKIKIGGIDFESELRIIETMRRVAPRAQLRLDANGAFAPHEALARLDRLARYDIHSIEQPIRQGQRDEMRRICRESPIPIALDEELISLPTADMDYLSDVRPAYIILKPTLLGGLSASAGWIEAAEEVGTGWWVTSALESDIGLNAIAQWTATLRPTLPQGLGTGQLYTNNIPSPLRLHGERLMLDPDASWQIPQLDWH